MAHPESKQATIALRESQVADQRFLIQPEDNDLFVRTGRQVIESCRLGISVDLWLKELAAVIESVREWTAARADRIAACYCAPRGAKTVLFFIPTSRQFDFDLGDELADLNGRLVREFNVGLIEVGQIPAAEVDRFLDPASARLVYGRSQHADSGSRRTVEA